MSEPKPMSEERLKDAQARADLLYGDTYALIAEVRRLRDELHVVRGTTAPRTQLIGQSKEIDLLRDCCRALKPFAEYLWKDSVPPLNPDMFRRAREAYKNAGVE